VSLSPAVPGFFRHLWLLWGLRLRIGMNGGPGRSRALAVAAFVASSAPGLLLGVGFYNLLRWEPVADSLMWSRFFLNLLCFVTSLTWTLWPLLSAGVDDHSEASRYQAFPISTFRLLSASTLASLLEPRAFVFYAPVVGAELGFLSVRPPSSWVLCAALFVLYALMNAAWSRLSLHLVLNVLRQKRSAELIGGFFLVFLIGASFIPPIPTEWLTQVAGGLGAVSSDLVAEAAVALSRVPSGFFGQGLIRLSGGQMGPALGSEVGMALFTAVPLYLAWRMLVRMQQDTGRAGPALPDGARRNRFATSRSRFSTLVWREALDLWRNPKARLLASVPFLLAILLKLISGRALFVHLLGASADAWLMGGLALYGCIVISSTFSQNTFAYDGHGFALFLAAPMEVGDVLRAKNLVHGVAGVGLGLLSSVFYLVYFGEGSLLTWACTMTAVLTLSPVLLAAGNLLSVFFPVKFHATLKRRDKLPFAASMLGVAAAALGALPFSAAVRLGGRQAPDGTTLALLLCAAALAFILYRRVLPLSLRLLHARREVVLRAVTRD
jgi:ABC-2 type transport system permease protein